MHVSIDIFSNEYDDDHGGGGHGSGNAKDAIFFQDGNGGMGGLFLLADYCHNKNDDNHHCIGDPTAHHARLYTAVVTARDKAGHTSTATCQTRIIDHHYKPKDDHKFEIDVSKSKQRFYITSHETIFHGGNSNATTGHYMHHMEEQNVVYLT